MFHLSFGFVLKMHSSSLQVQPFYCLEAAGGEKVICGLAIRGERNRMSYKPSDYLVEEYCEIFPLGVVAEWNFSCQLDVWLDSIVYHSFVRYNQKVQVDSSLLHLVISNVHCVCSSIFCLLMSCIFFLKVTFQFL